ncbi:hypothetical protein, partial [Streptomyces sp. BE303]|uniref:hypothetical protein n=1 Tax=Streptomyces sp. BE303 TaxID=3002528 RepID=UPI002E784519
TDLAEAAPRGRWAIVGDEASVRVEASEFAEALTALGADAVVVPLGDSADLATRLRELEPAGILGLPAVSLAGALAVVQASAEVAGGAPLWLATRGAVSVGRADG